MGGGAFADAEAETDADIGGGGDDAGAEADMPDDGFVDVAGFVVVLDRGAAEPELAVPSQPVVSVIDAVPTAKPPIRRPLMMRPLTYLRMEGTLLL